MTNEIEKNSTDNNNRPIFTGKTLRDMNVSEGEKAAELSEAIFEYVKNKLHEDKGADGKNE